MMMPLGLAPCPCRGLPSTVDPTCRHEPIRRSLSDCLFTCCVPKLLYAFPSYFHGRIRRPQHQAVAGEFVAAHQIAALARLQIVMAMMDHRAGLLVDRVGTEIGDVILQRGEGLVRRHHRTGALALDVGRDLHRHLAVRAVIDHALRILATIPVAAVDARADIAPGADQPLRGRFRVSVHHVTEMYCVSRNSSMPSCAPSRPRPDCFVPPNGAAGSETRPRLSPIMPKSSCSETRMPRLKSLV